MSPDDALVALGRSLREEGYRFNTVTPETHERIWNRHPAALARDARDVFGWNRWFLPAVLSPRLFAHLEASGELDRSGALCRSRVRAATFRDLTILHSSFPTAQADSVFFGPDTYRFTRILDWARQEPSQLGVDVGCGSGAAGLLLSRTCQQVILSDINPQALRLAGINARINGIHNCRTVLSDCLAAIPAQADLIVANPPYLVDAAQRTYRHGGGSLGTGLAVRILTQALERLPASGRVGIYTGVPIVAGEDRFWREIQPHLGAPGLTTSYEELDPDVFSEELDAPAYAETERLAVVALTVRMPAEMARPTSAT